METGKCFCEGHKVTERSPSIGRIKELTLEMGEDWSLADWVTS